MDTKKFKVVVTDYEFASLDCEQEILNKVGAQLIPAQCKTEDDLIAVARDADGLLNLYFGPINRKVIESLRKCKVISRYGIGIDTIDIQAATDHGIIVTNVPSYCIDEISDHAIALILCCNRKITLLNNAVKNGQWDFKTFKPVYRLRDKILGLIGFGKIGKSVTKKARVFGFNILFYDPYVPEEISRKYSVRSASLEELLKESDFVSVHTLLNEETHHLLSEKQFKMMKNTAFLINTARGGIVDTEALYKALREGWIAGAALDLIEGVPPLTSQNLLIKLENVIVTPHAAWYSEESIIELQISAAQEVARVLKGEWPLSVVNPEVKEKSCIQGMK